MFSESFVALVLFLSGEVAFAAASTPIELKILVETSSKVQGTLQALRFNRAFARRSDLYFYDTKDLRLYSAGLLIRSRDYQLGSDEVVVKARPLEAADLDDSWFQVMGLRCEIDASPSKTTPSCSIHSYVSQSVLSSVMKRQNQVPALLTADQEIFANDFGGFDLVRDSVVPLGPIVSWRWKTNSKSGWNVEAEYWRLPDGTEFVELSVRGREADHMKMDTALRSLMIERGLEAASVKTNKTAVALQSLASRAIVLPKPIAKGKVRAR